MQGDHKRPTPTGIAFIVSALTAFFNVIGWTIGTMGYVFEGLFFIFFVPVITLVAHIVGPRKKPRNKD